MMKTLSLISLLAIAVTASTAAAESKNTNTTTPLSIVTWNVEHLAAKTGQGCKARSEADYAELKNYAERIKADVVALQEVGSADAVARIFPTNQWQIVMSDRPDSDVYTCRDNGRTSTQQKVAFAVKKSIQIDQVEQVTELSKPLPGLRQGIKLTINIAGEKVNLLNVHLKSGCFVKDYSSSDKEACTVLSQQIQFLDTFLEAKSRSNEHWVVLGDFNHRLAEEDNRFRKDLLHSPGLFSEQSKPSDFLQNLTDGMTGCHPKYPAPIDHILISRGLANKLTQNSVQFHLFDDMQPSAMLSDHCALEARFAF